MAYSISSSMTELQQRCHQFRCLCNTQGYVNRIQRIFGEERANWVLAWIFAGSRPEMRICPPIYNFSVRVKAQFEQESEGSYEACEKRAYRLMGELTNSYNHRTKILDAIERMKRGEEFLSLEQLLAETQYFDPSQTRQTVPFKDVPIVDTGWTREETQWLESKIHAQRAELLKSARPFLDLDVIAILFSEWRATSGLLPPAERRVSRLRDYIAEVAKRIFPTQGRLFSPCQGDRLQMPCLEEVMRRSIIPTSIPTNAPEHPLEAPPLSLTPPSPIASDEQSLVMDLDEPPPLVGLDGLPFIEKEPVAVTVDEEAPALTSAKELPLPELSHKTAGIQRHLGKLTQTEKDYLSKTIEEQKSGTKSVNLQAIINAFMKWRSESPEFAYISPCSERTVRRQIERYLRQKEHPHLTARSIFTKSLSQQKHPSATTRSISRPPLLCSPQSPFLFDSFGGIVE